MNRIMLKFFSKRAAALTSQPQPIGNQAERRAEAFLAAHGMQTQARNFRCRHGEIDLVMRDGPTLVFVEVRLRRRRDYGGAAESIDLPKQRHIVRAAQHYLAGIKPVPPCRFDAVLLDSLDETGIEWVRAAFGE